jgi:hypothetical protein
MKKLLNKIKNAALWVWQAPQNIVGLITYNCYKGYEICTKETCGEDIKCKLSIKMSGGITLGQYIILNNISHLNHELGHTKQSEILGPLYLLVIGLPSLLHAWVHPVLCKNKNYYHFFTEMWANKLMGIEK